MRKTFIIVLLSLVIAVPLIAGAHPSEGAGNVKSYETMTWPDIIPVYSQTGGTAYILNGAFVDLAKKHMPGVNFISEGTSGTFEIMNLLEERAKNGRAAMSFNSSDGVYMSRIGEGLFETPLTEVYQASFLTGSELWLTTPRRSGIRTLEDVRGKRIGVGPVGSAIAVLSETLLDAYGVTFDDFEPFFVNYEGANSGMADGSLDGGFYGGPPPFAVYEDMASIMEITAIGVSEEKAAMVMAENPFYGTKTLPAGIMAGLDEDTLVLMLMEMINMNSAISEDLGYAILEMLFDNVEEFRTYAPRALADLSLESWHWAVCSEIHPGAIKFFTEKGVFNR